MKHPAARAVRVGSGRSQGAIQHDIRRALPTTDGAATSLIQPSTQWARPLGSIMPNRNCVHRSSSHILRSGAQDELGRFTGTTVPRAVERQCNYTEMSLQAVLN